MFCRQCGTKSEDAAGACAKCGTASTTEPPKEKSGMDTYNTFAETVGMVPSLRLKDNLFQGIFVLVGTLLAALAGFIMGQTSGLLVGALLGLIGSGLLSGTILAVIGLVRAGKK